MGIGTSSQDQRPFETLFGPNQATEACRGPTLGAVLIPDADGRGWRLALVAPQCIQVFDAYTAETITPEATGVATALREHAPLTAYCSVDAASSSSSSGGGSSPDVARTFAVGCQDGSVLLFGLQQGLVRGPLRQFQIPSGAEASTRVARGAHEGGVSVDQVALPYGVCDAGPAAGLASSVTALHFDPASNELYAGTVGRISCWDLTAGELTKEFHLPGSSDDHPATAICMCVIRTMQHEVEKRQLWVGLDVGNIVVFDSSTGFLVRTFCCAGPEAVVSLTSFATEGVVFALSAHRRVSVWEAASCTLVQKYSAELITCGADLSVMAAVHVQDLEASLLFLAGIDGSLCIRRVTRRADGKLNCVLLGYLEHASSHAGCPITTLSYHADTDSVLVGDAGCAVTLVAKLRSHLCPTAANPAAKPSPHGGESPTASASQVVDEIDVDAAAEASTVGGIGNPGASIPQVHPAAAPARSGESVGASFVRTPSSPEHAAVPFPVFSGD